MTPSDNLREAVITILEDHISGSSDLEEAADAILSLPALQAAETRAQQLEARVEELERRLPELIPLFEEGARKAKEAKRKDWHGRFIYAAERVHQALSAPLACCDSAGRCTFACELAPCAYCGAVRDKPCNDMLCPWAPPSPRVS